MPTVVRLVIDSTYVCSDSLHQLSGTHLLNLFSFSFPGVSVIYQPQLIIAHTAMGCPSALSDVGPIRWELSWGTSVLLHMASLYMWCLIHGLFRWPLSSRIV